MKVQLIVVQGKPEGKVIPLVGPIFKIGRGETCQLRPASEQVSREHAEFTVNGEVLSVRDLGSRNGTLVNGKAVSQPCVLKDRDLVQVGPLTFAVAITGVTAGKPAAPAPARSAPDDVAADDIDSWLVGDSKNPLPDRPSGVYGGETITVTSFREGTPSKPVPVETPKKKEKEEVIEFPGDDAEEFAEASADDEDGDADSDEDGGGAGGGPEEFVDESNPFYVKKKEPEGPVKPVYKDTSDAANDILRRMMERRRGGGGR